MITNVTCQNGTYHQCAVNTYKNINSYRLTPIDKIHFNINTPFQFIGCKAESQINKNLQKHIDNNVTVLSASTTAKGFVQIKSSTKSKPHIYSRRLDKTNVFFEIFNAIHQVVNNQRIYHNISAFLPETQCEFVISLLVFDLLLNDNGNVDECIKKVIASLKPSIDKIKQIVNFIQTSDVFTATYQIKLSDLEYLFINNHITGIALNKEEIKIIYNKLKILENKIDTTDVTPITLYCADIKERLLHTHKKLKKEQSKFLEYQAKIKRDEVRYKEEQEQIQKLAVKQEEIKQKQEIATTEEEKQNCEVILTRLNTEKQNRDKMLAKSLLKQSTAKIEKVAMYQNLKDKEELKQELNNVLKETEKQIEDNNFAPAQFSGLKASITCMKQNLEQDKPLEHNRNFTNDLAAKRQTTKKEVGDFKYFKDRDANLKVFKDYKENCNKYLSTDKAFSFIYKTSMVHLWNNVYNYGKIIQGVKAWLWDCEPDVIDDEAWMYFITAVQLNKDYQNGYSKKNHVIKERINDWNKLDKPSASDLLNYLITNDYLDFDKFNQEITEFQDKIEQKLKMLNRKLPFDYYSIVLEFGTFDHNLHAHICINLLETNETDTVEKLVKQAFLGENKNCNATQIMSVKQNLNADNWANYALAKYNANSSYIDKHLFAYLLNKQIIIDAEINAYDQKMLDGITTNKDNTDYWFFHYALANFTQVIPHNAKNLLKWGIMEQEGKELVLNSNITPESIEKLNMQLYHVDKYIRTMKSYDFIAEHLNKINGVRVDMETDLKDYVAFMQEYMNTDFYYCSSFNNAIDKEQVKQELQSIVYNDPNNNHLSTKELNDLYKECCDAVDTQLPYDLDLCGNFNQGNDEETKARFMTYVKYLIEHQIPFDLI